MKTRLVDTWKEGGAAINAWLSTSNAVTAEMTSKADVDSITVDLQHGLNDYLSALSLFQAISASDATPMARPPWLEAGIIMKLLDAGAMGIICPMINTAVDAENFVRYTHYAPRGTRSFGPTRAAMVYGADYWSKADDALVTLAMIETVEALENLEAIVKTPDLTGVYIGPSDLSLSMGETPKLDHDTPAVLDAIAHIRETAHAAGIKACIHCVAPEYARNMIAQGFDLVTVGSDLRLYAAALNDAISKVRA